MSTKNLQSGILKEARDLFFENSRISNAIDAVLFESEDYAADELVELAEEILHQIAAVGVAHYIRHTPQKEV